MGVQWEVVWTIEMYIRHSRVDRIESYEVFLSVWSMIVITVEMTVSQIEVCNIADVLHWSVFTFVSSVFAFHGLYHTYRRLYAYSENILGR
jgi:hypothetical protein